MIYRVVNESRMDQVKELWDYCFEKKEDPFFQYYFNEYCGKNNWVIAGFEEKETFAYLKTMVHVNPYKVRIRNCEDLVPYLVGVATAPEARGQHLFEPLAKKTFEVLRSEEVSFVTLMPIYAGIYTPYEFAYYDFRHEYNLSLSDLASLSGKTYGVRLEKVELGSLDLSQVYDAYTQNLSGVPLRTEFQWKKLLTVHSLENTECVLAYENDELVGYMLYKLEDETFNALEIITLTNESKSALLNYAAQHQAQCKEFTWLAPAWDKTYLSFKDQKLSGSYKPFMMARCIDARRALANLEPDEELYGEINLLLNDDLIERNNHLLRLVAVDGELIVESTMDGEDISMGMAAFTQMYLGAFTASELAEAGLIKVRSAEKLEILDKLFPKLRTFNNEYF